jgi:hypothetical protein
MVSKLFSNQYHLYYKREKKKTTVNLKHTHRRIFICKHVSSVKGLEKKRNMFVDGYMEPNVSYLEV